MSFRDLIQRHDYSRDGEVGGVNYFVPPCSNVEGTSTKNMVGCKARIFDWDDNAPLQMALQFTGRDDLPRIDLTYDEARAIGMALIMAANEYEKAER